MSTQSKRDVIRLFGKISKLRQKNLVGSKDTKDKDVRFCLQCPAAVVSFYHYTPFCILTNTNIRQADVVTS